MASRTAYVRRHDPTIIEALDEVEHLGGRIWERRPNGSGLRATVGLGTSRWLPPIANSASLPPEIAADLERHALVALQPAAVDLEPRDGFAVHGDRDRARSIVRSILVQFATWTGPADWQLLVVSREPDRWAWAGWLPHAGRVDGSPAVVVPEEIDIAAAGLAGDRITVLVTDDVSLFDARTGPARRIVAATSAIVVAAVDRAHSVPSICGKVLRLGSTGRAVWSDGSPVVGFPEGIHAAGLDDGTADWAARALAPLVDPEDPASASAALPVSLRLADLDEPGRSGDARDRTDEIVGWWRRAGTDPAPRAPIGISADGVVDIDLVRDGPHALIAGTTGSGKSELLRTLVVGLACRSSPDHLTFVLVDYKGGSTFDACAGLPHTVGLVTDLDEGDAARALLSLEAELRRRERILRDVAASDLTEYRTRPGAESLPRLVVVVDEFAALAHELPDFLVSLVGIAQRGRSLGVHLLLATQRPAGVVSDDIRANTNLRLALRLHDAADARDVVGDELPATLPRAVAGRAVLRLGPDELVVFQAARCTGPAPGRAAGLAVAIHDHGGTSPPSAPAGSWHSDEASELALVVAAVRRAAERLAIAPPHRPWLEPLPALLDPAAVDRAVASGADDAASAHDAVGLIDDPDHQARHALRWDPAAGNLALVGPLGAGTTTTLVALAAALCRTRSSERLHLYVIDAVGDPVLDDLESVAHCGAVVRAHDLERLHRLLVRLAGVVDDRPTAGASQADTVLLVDGFDSLRASLASVERAETLALLDRVTADGPAAGVFCIGTGPQVARLPGAERWVFPDRPSSGSVRTPGRLRIASTGLEAQVARDVPAPTSLADRSDRHGPLPVEVLSERIDRDTLRPSWSSGGPPDATDHLVVGRSAEHLDDIAVAVPAGDHVFVGGPSRSGKSTALRTLVAAWRDLHPVGVVLDVDRRHPLGLDDLAGGRTLVVVDDADRVDDDSIAALANDHRPGVTLMIAARPEAVRSMYGHWTRDVVRSRCGLILTAPGEVDGELLGAVLPRRTLIPPRAGLGWLIDPGGHRLAQVAVVGGS